MRLKNLLALLCLLHAVSPLPLRAATAGEGASAGEAVEEGIRHYEALEYEEAMAAFEQALAAPDAGKDERLEAYAYLGLIHLGMNQREAAVSRLLELLRIDPDFDFDYALRSPKVLAALDEARERYIRELRAEDAGPPVIQISPVTEPVAHGRPLGLTFRISDQSRLVQRQVFYRKHGEPTYAFVALEPQGQEVYLATLPSSALTGESVEYYVVAIDEAGNAAISGTAGTPLSLEVQPDPQLRPWYKKWWVWGLVAVVAGGATTAGVLLASGDDDPGAGPAEGSAIVTFGP